MTPTTRFRYIERETRIYICDGIARIEQHKILQQWWEPERNIIDAVAEKKMQGEWRDIPLEKEQ
jgi:hypothetical protein